MPVNEERFELLPMDKLLYPWQLLRPVIKDSVEFLELVDSIRRDGLLCSISVRPSETQEGYYEIIDGLWRYEAVRRLQKAEIPAIIKIGVTNEEVLVLQLAANAISFETRPLEFAKQLRKMMKIREQTGTPINAGELGAMCNKSRSWVNSRLSLLELHSLVQKRLEEGGVSLSQATHIARIKSPQGQLEAMTLCNTMTARELELWVNDYIFRQRLNSQMAIDDYRKKLPLIPHLRPMRELLHELDTMESISVIISQNSERDPLSAAKSMLEWVLTLDDNSREVKYESARWMHKADERREIIGRQQYDELKKIEQLQKEKKTRKRVNFSDNEEVNNDE